MSRQYSTLQSLTLLVARIGFVIMFFIGGQDQIANFYTFAAAMSNKGIPFSQWVLGIGMAVEAFAVLSILFGYYARLGGFLLFGFMLVSTLAFHSFWAFSAADFTANMQQFFQNISIACGALFISVSGAGRFSLDRS